MTPPRAANDRTLMTKTITTLDGDNHHHLLAMVMARPLLPPLHRLSYALSSSKDNFFRFGRVRQYVYIDISCADLSPMIGALRWLGFGRIR